MTEKEQTKEALRLALEQANTKIAGLEKRLLDLEQAKFHNVIDASPVPYALNDDDGDITYLNPAFIAVFGYTLEDIPTLEHWWPKAYPDESYRQWVIDSWREHLDTAARTGAPFEPLELQICCKDGSIRTVLASAAPLCDTYKGEHLVILYDITGRKKIEDALSEQEKELVDIIDHLPSMIFLKEAKELRYARFNRAGERLTGISREQIIGKNDYDFFPKEQADFFTGRDRVVLASGELEDIPDEPIDTPQGTRSLHTRKVAIYGKDGEPKYLLGVSDDITEHKKADAERQRLQRELQQVHKMESIGNLTGGIAHDFNNLLGIITGYTSLGHEYCKNKNETKLLTYLEHIHTASERATSLVAQMLAFSRNDPADLEPVDLSLLVKEDIKMLRATLPASMQIETQIDEDLPGVLMNATQLNQILMNLAVNARDAMDGAGLMTVRLGWVRDLHTESSVSHQPISGDWVELAVTDTGCGIDASTFDDIFTPFYTSKMVGKGTGMGLAVIYGIMKGCNGHILVDSAEGKGSTFRMLFPPLDVPAKPMDSNNLKTRHISGAGEEVLIVDDEESLAGFVGELISHHGYVPHVVTDSERALATYKENPSRFPIVVTDQTMPKLTGLQLIQQMREITPSLPAILCSGYSDKVNPQEAENQDICYMQKPVDGGGLVQRIGELLKKTAA
ncbi:MAG: PAS domain-containing protein [Gammaproteobacteria bacterium]|nr:PAS domain-containing protein [Gammaproteobacteria bacterium]MDH5802921.1 PAS domain-containing protein [Gammaproteobacteria bacterium]